VIVREGANRGEKKNNRGEQADQKVKTDRKTGGERGREGWRQKITKKEGERRSSVAEKDFPQQERREGKKQTKKKDHCFCKWEAKTREKKNLSDETE